MKKVLFVISNLLHGGAEKVLINLANNLDRTKYSVTIQAIFNEVSYKDLIKPYVNYKYNFNRMPRGSAILLKLFSPKKLFRMFIKDEYDIIVSYLESLPARIVSGCPKENKRRVTARQSAGPRPPKLISWIHSVQNRKTIRRPFRSFAEYAKCYDRFDAAVCVSEKVKEHFMSLLNVKIPVKVLYNTVESGQIIEKSKEKIDDVTFDKNIINIISVGKLEHVKGYLRLAEIHDRLNKEGIRNYHIYIIGTGSQENKIKKFLKNKRISEGFTFLGFKNNPYKYLSQSNLFVCSSYSEGFSTAATEALITGTPVLATDVSGMKEMLGENEFGMIVENDTDSLYQGLKKLITERELLAHYKEKAVERGKMFSKEKTVKAVEEFFEGLFI